MRLRRMNPDVHDWSVRLMLACLIWALTCVPGMSQTRQATLEIGSHVISLGAPVDTVISKLQKDYTVTVGANSSLRSWSVSTGNKDRLPFGTIYAKGSTVVGISKVVLGREIHSSGDIFEALFEAASELDAKKRNDCVVTTITAYVAGISKASIHLSCGEYRIYLLRNEFETSKGDVLVSYLIMEELGTTD